jgi:ATPase family associated with various cellular activities (AAA)
LTEAAAPIQPLDLGGQIVFLAGPPGSGKTSLGSRVCQELGLRFASLPDGTSDLGRAAMEAVIRQRSADVVELPWTLQLAEGVFREARQAGRLIGLWTHPVDMQARSGRSEPFITPGEN